MSKEKNTQSKLKIANNNLDELRKQLEINAAKHIQDIRSLEISNDEEKGFAELDHSTQINSLKSSHLANIQTYQTKINDLDTLITKLNQKLIDFENENRIIKNKNDLDLIDIENIHKKLMINKDRYYIELVSELRLEHDDFLKNVDTIRNDQVVKEMDPYVITEHLTSILRSHKNKMEGINYKLGINLLDMKSRIKYDQNDDISNS